MIDIQVLPDGRTVTYTAEVEEEVIEEEEDIEITGSRVMTTWRKENNQEVEEVVRLTEGEVIRVSRTNSRCRVQTTDLTSDIGLTQSQLSIESRSDVQPNQIFLTIGPGFIISSLYRKLNSFKICFPTDLSTERRGVLGRY